MSILGIHLHSSYVDIGEGDIKMALSAKLNGRSQNCS